MKQESLLRRLERPKGPIDVILDTDTYNEIDDQFALAYMLKNEDKLRVQALYAAPFFNENSTGPKDGMERSFEEIHKILRLMEREDLSSVVFKGSETYLPSETEAVPSPAASDLAERAMRYTEENPLYVVAIGAITNIASALIMRPEIRDRIVIVWLGGHALFWPDTKEFNMVQDIAAARVIFGCGAAFVQLPCMGVVSHFTISEPELNAFFRGKNRICDYLAENTIQAVRRYTDRAVWTRVIWDVTAVAWLLDESFMSDRLLHCPIPEYDGLYAYDDSRHFYRYVYRIDRDRLMADLVRCLTR